MNATTESVLRGFARRHLPIGIRQPLGAVGGRIRDAFLRPLQGFWFDLTGARFRTDGCVFEIPKHLTSRAYRACFVTGEYEDDERALIKRFLRADDRVLELGACMGIVSCVTNRLLGDRKAQVVVEGNPMLIPTLHRNRHLNGCEFLVENAAASPHSEVSFYLHQKYVVGGSTRAVSEVSCRIPGRNLRELDGRYGPFTTLIMDIEGGELEALRGCGELLRRFRLVIIELHAWAIGDDGVAECRKMFADAGLEKVGESGITDAWQRA